MTGIQIHKFLDAGEQFSLENPYRFHDLVQAHEARELCEQTFKVCFFTLIENLLCHMKC
jgi:hypothetical protein